MTMLLRDSDLDIAACTIAREAGGEPWEGQVAVAYVFKNRWLTKDGQFAKDDTLATTCLRHLQFSVWNEGDPNFPKLFKLSPTDMEYRVALRALLTALDGVEPDQTHGSRHYHTRSVSPIWANGKVPVAEIGNHLFYNDVS